MKTKCCIEVCGPDQVRMNNGVPANFYRTGRLVSVELLCPYELLPACSVPGVSGPRDGFAAVLISSLPIEYHPQTNSIIQTIGDLCGNTYVVYFNESRCLMAYSTTGRFLPVSSFTYPSSCS